MTARIRVLHCIPHMDGGGAERQCATLAAAQVRHGLDIHVALLRGGPHLARLEAGGARVHVLTAASNHDPRIGARLVALLRRLRPGIVQTWLPQMDVLGGGAALLTRTPWVLSERASAAAYTHRWKDRVLRRAVGRHARAVVANSCSGAAYWADAAPAVARHVVLNVLALDDIAAAAPRPASALDIDPATPQILFAGRLAPQKNLGWLIAALGRLFASRAGIALIAGDGPDRPALTSLARAAGIGDRVRFLGYRDDIWQIMKGAAVLVNPSRFEGQPNAVAEAMACGVPVVVSDIAEHRELVGDGGTLVPLGEAAALADAIARALDRDGDTAARIARAKTRVAAFTAERAVEQYAAVYATLLGRAAARGGAEPISAPAGG